MGIEAFARVISCILFSIMFYWAIPGMNPRASAFFFFILAQIITTWAGLCITLATSSIVPSMDIASGGIKLYALFNVAIMGFLTPVPLWWGWATFISYARW